jgi:cobalt-zinc-cadmium efflux system outer membrane protein
VVERARGYGPWREAQAGEEKRAASEVLGEEAWPGASVGFLHEEIFPDQQTREETLIVSQPFDLSGRRGLRQEAARRRVQAQGFEREARGAERGALARERFYLLMAAQRRWEAAQRWEAQVGQVERLLERREAAGLSSRYDRERVGRELERARALVAREGGEVLEAWRALAGLWGGSEGEAPSLEGELLPSAPGSLEARVEGVRRGPSWRGAQARAEASERDRAASEVWLPPMSVGLGWRRLDSQGQAGQGFAVELGMDLPWGGQREASRVEAQGAGEQARAELEGLELEGASEVRRLYEALVGLRGQAEERRAALGRSQGFLELAREGYERGQLGILEVLEAARLCLEDELELAELEREARLRAVALDVWSGGEEP